MAGGLSDDLSSQSRRYDSDKAGWQSYLGVYDDVLAPLKDRPVVLLELGVRKGGSLLMWRDFLPKAQIIGLDLEIPPLDDDSGRICTYEGSQSDTALLERIIDEQAPDGFDVVIDDCAHVGEHASASFRTLFPALKPGGTYVIEDWGTGYWPDWPDGERLAPQRSSRTVRRSVDDVLRRVGDKLNASGRGGGAVIRIRRTLAAHRQPQHIAGMVGFVKQLVDEVAADDVRRGGGAPPFGASIRSMTIHPSLVVIQKA